MYFVFLCFYKNEINITNKTKNKKQKRIGLFFFQNESTFFEFQKRRGATSSVFIVADLLYKNFQHCRFPRSFCAFLMTKARRLSTKIRLNFYQTTLMCCLIECWKFDFPPSFWLNAENLILPPRLWSWDGSWINLVGRS